MLTHPIFTHFHPCSTTMFPLGTSVMFVRSTGEPFLAQVVGHSEHSDAYRRITYDHDGKTVLHDRASVRRLSLPHAPSPPRVYGGGAVPQGGVGDRHLVTVPRGVVGDRLPWVGERQGGGYQSQGRTTRNLLRDHGGWRTSLHLQRQQNETCLCCYIALLSATCNHLLSGKGWQKEMQIEHLCLKDK